MLPLFAVAAGAVFGSRLPSSGRERAGVSGFVWLFVMAAATVAPSLADVSGVTAFLVSQFALCAFLIRNRRHAGALVIAAGIALNALPILLNGGMPVSVSAAEAVGVDPPTSESSHHIPMGDETHLNFLGDAIPFTPTGQVLSLGDLVMLTGFAAVAYSVVGPLLGGSRAPRPQLSSAGETSAKSTIGRMWI